MYQCSSVIRPASDIKSVRSLDPLDKLSNDFHTQTLVQTRIKEVEGQSPRIMKEGESIHRGAGGEADIHD